MGLSIYLSVCPSLGRIKFITHEIFTLELMEYGAYGIES